MCNEKQARCLHEGLTLPTLDSSPHWRRERPSLLMAPRQPLISMVPSPPSAAASSLSNVGKKLGQGLHCLLVLPTRVNANSFTLSTGLGAGHSDPLARMESLS